MDYEKWYKLLHKHLLSYYVEDILLDPEHRENIYKHKCSTCLREEQEVQSDLSIRYVGEKIGHESVWADLIVLLSTSDIILQNIKKNLWLLSREGLYSICIFEG